MLDLSIIIVSWNVAELLAACLDSILSGTVQVSDTDGDQLDIEIIVVDSASTDDTVLMVEERYPQVKLLRQSENLGFSHCNNIGLSAASGRNILLLNPDTEIVGNALPRMAGYLDDNAAVGIVGPQTLNSDGTVQSTRRRFPTVPLAFFESTWLQPYTPQAWLNRYVVADAPDDAILDVDWVQGSALMLRREVYEQIGGLDTGFVMYSEELDWCKRAKNAGWRVVYLGTAQIVHHGGKSSEQVVGRKHVYFQESKLRYFRKHHGSMVAFLLRGFLLLSYVWQIGLETGKSLLGNKRQMRRERIKAYWQVVRSGLKAR